MSLINPKIFFGVFVVFIIFFLNVKTTFASSEIGDIDSTYSYAWGENIGWVNFGCDNCAVRVTDSFLLGYGWNRQFGWINLNPDSSLDSSGLLVGVKNDGHGMLSGYAWSSNLGWINFSNVIIENNGEFSGYATIKSDGSKINFNCISPALNSCSVADFKVKTDWRPANLRGGNSSGAVIYNPSNPPANPPNPPNPPANPPANPPVDLPPKNPVFTVSDNFLDVLNSASDLALEFFGFKKDKVKKENLVEIAKIPSPALNTKWNLLPKKEIKSFVFAPLPYEVRILASKFPELDQTLKAVGVERLSDFDELTGVTFNIKGLAQLEKTVRNIGVDKLDDIDAIKGGVDVNVPKMMSSVELEKSLIALGINKVSDLDNVKNTDLQIAGLTNEELKKKLENLGVEKITDISDINSVALDIPVFSNMNGKINNNIGVGKIALISGLPVAKFSDIAKQNLPSEFVFARAGGELVDLNVALSIGNKGEVTQKISSLPGKTLKLVVKPISKARSVTGYFVFKSYTPKISQNEISRSSLVASPFFSLRALVEKDPDPIPVETKLVLSSFRYEDPDGDGIYTADVEAPVVPGEYEVITVIEYTNPTLGTRQMRMITVIDPEGYVFESKDGKETRIPSAIVSLYWLNPISKKYELWRAEDYQQENPQITDVRGTYSFLVPEGSYYFHVEAPGYVTFEGKAFVISEGNGIHKNIELKSSRGFLVKIDWKTLLLIAVFLLLVYNLYTNKLKDKLLEIFKKHE